MKGKWLALIAASVTLAATTLAASASPAQAAVCPGGGPNDLLSFLKPSGRLAAGQSVWSQGCGYRLIMQTDGNLVLYGPGGAIWASNTSSRDSWAEVTTTGAFRVRSPAPPGTPSFTRWTSGLVGTPLGVNQEAQLKVQSDGKLMIYRHDTVSPFGWYPKSWNCRWTSGQPNVGFCAA